MNGRVLVLTLSTLLSGVLQLSAMADSQESSKALVGSASGIGKGAAMSNTKDGADFIHTIFKAADSLNDYSFHYGMRAFKKSGDDLEEGYFYFKKPRLMRIEVTRGSRKGSVAILQANGKVRGHMGGPLGVFKATLSPESDLLRSPNGYPMQGSDFRSLYDYLENMIKKGDRSTVTVEPVAYENVANKVYVLDMQDRKDLLLKRILVNPQTFLPEVWFDYTDGKLVAHSYWTDIKTDTGLSDKLFHM